MPNVRNSTQSKKRPRIKDAKRIFTVTDPLQKMTRKKVDCRSGSIEPSRSSGYLETADPTLANELKSRYPWMLVTEHEKQAGRDSSTASFRVNGLRQGRFTDEEMERDGWVRNGAHWVKRLKQ